MATDDVRERRGSILIPAWFIRAPSLPAPTDDPDARSMVWRKLNDQFGWYARAAARNRAGYLLGRVTALLVGGVVTVLAAINAPPALTASFAAAVVAAEGIQQLFQFHSNWLGYRAAAETLRSQGFLFAAVLAPYDDVETRQGLLANVITATTSREHQAWQSAMQQPTASRH